VSATPLGLVAGTLTTGAWLPQLVRTWRLGRAEEISWAYLGVLGSGITCWLIYGLILSSVAIIAANGATLALLLTLTAMKIRTRPIDQRLAEEPTPVP
jgi:MtN3 and saliva related transmembrane protein